MRAGRNVPQAMQGSLLMKPGALNLTWESLRRVGNLSHSSVLPVPQETLARACRRPGATG